MPVPFDLAARMREMIDHDAFMEELVSAQQERGGSLERADILELLIEHIASSDHRMALPAHWSKEAVITKLYDVFTDDALIARMIDTFELTLSMHPSASVLPLSANS